MRNNGKGGMQTSGTQPAIVCPKCGKAAATMVINEDTVAYMHFTRKGTVRHIKDLATDNWTAKRRRGMEI